MNSKTVKRILCIDYGDRNTGLAISDAMGWTAQPLDTIRRADSASLKSTIERICELVSYYDIGTVVIGYPKNMDNSEGTSCEKVKHFAGKLGEEFLENLPEHKVEIVFWDERMSTMAAQRVLLEADMSRGKRKNVVDKTAAAYILQGYLEYISKKEV